ncbi:DUF664 domain-containing protein [Corynebacterium lactis]|uniref:Mini-circle protein n=1 Tax=Corynebacterium lactis RW2-5 TaxID=1408189 RepID=A0A0K2H375_9CORY|nr:DUF664 domain-containing protein [Corynebacterium lactis]ALA68500.1 hypothetical protein CLAC_04840 [Corynebacterium lactis RW2-5]
MSEITDTPIADTSNPAWPLDSHILARMDKLAALVASLDDALANEKLPIPAINTPIVLLRHVGGSARYWLERVCLGRDYFRDRTGEFSASGSVAEELAIYREQRAAIARCLEELRSVDRSAPPACVPTDKERWWCASIEGVIVHVFHEAAQHLGHAEITRDALVAGAAGAADSARPAATSLLDAVIAELQESGHAADFIEGTKITTVDGLELSLDEVVKAGVRKVTSAQQQSDRRSQQS